MGDLGVEFQLNTSELSRIAATAFWGSPVSMIIGGAIVDKVGMKNLMRLAYLGHFAGILLTIFAGALDPVDIYPFNWPSQRYGGSGV